MEAYFPGMKREEKSFDKYFEPLNKEILEPCITENIETDMEKLKQVFHYIVDAIGSQANTGKTLLFKILYFCDFDYYLEYEELLTKELYRKIDHGPAPIHFDEIVEQLEKEGKILTTCKEKTNPRDYKKYTYISLLKPDLSLLSAKEIKFIDETLDKYSHYKSTEISEISHQDLPWRATENSDIIDYDLVFYRDNLLLEEDNDDDC